MLNVARYDVFKLGEAVLAGQVGARACACSTACRPRARRRCWCTARSPTTSWRSSASRMRVAAGRPMPMALRENRVWGAKERLFERVLPLLSERAWSELVDAASVCDGVVKGLKHPDWPDDPWQGLQRLALMICERVPSATSGRRGGGERTAAGAVPPEPAQARQYARERSTRCCSGRPARSAATLAATMDAALRGSVCAATCGSTVTGGWLQNGWSAGSGSVAKTSRTAWRKCPLSSAASRSASTTCAPRARFTRLAPRGSGRASRHRYRPCVAGVSGSRLTTTCAVRQHLGQRQRRRRMSPRRRSTAGRELQPTHAIAVVRQPQRDGAAHLAETEHAHRDSLGAALLPRRPASRALLHARSRRSRGAARARPTSAVCAIASFIAGSTMRASGTSRGDGGVARAASSTPAQSDWIKRKRGQPGERAGARVGDDGDIDVVGAGAAPTSRSSVSPGSALDNAGHHRAHSSGVKPAATRMLMQRAGACRFRTPARAACASACWTVCARTAARSPRSCSNSARAGSPRCAMASQTVPTGFPGVAPPGPAMPVTATATWRSEWASAPSAIAQRDLGADGAVARRSAPPARPATRTWPRCSRSQSRARTSRSSRRLRCRRRRSGRRCTTRRSRASSRGRAARCRGAAHQRRDRVHQNLHRATTSRVHRAATRSSNMMPKPCAQPMRHAAGPPRLEQGVGPSHRAGLGGVEEAEQREGHELRRAAAGVTSHSTSQNATTSSHTIDRGRQRQGGGPYGAGPATDDEAGRDQGGPLRVAKVRLQRDEREPCPQRADGAGRHR